MGANTILVFAQSSHSFMAKTLKFIAQSHPSFSFKPLNFALSSIRPYAKLSSSSFQESAGRETEPEEEDVVASSGIRRPLSEMLKQLSKKVPDSMVKLRHENGSSYKYIPWHIVNRMMNVHAPEWSGEVRSITYSADGKSVSVVYRVTLYGTHAETYRESTGTASVADTNYGEPVQKAEAMAFRRACARLGLGLHLYHEEIS